MLIYSKLLKLSCFLCLYAQHFGFAKDQNASSQGGEIIRVLKPGVVDYQTDRYLLRLRAWGVGFPKRDQPGYNEAISFTEKHLIGTDTLVDIKREFDQENLKVADINLPLSSTTFSKLAISEGIGWHLEKETSRYGYFVMAELKAKRRNLGIWAANYNYQSTSILPNISPSSPLLPKIMGGSNVLPTIRYWVTSFGKIHRPSCSFYERGRGELSSRPTGVDCRICGGAKR